MKLSAAAIAKFIELIKSTPEIHDLFEDYHDSLTKEEIKTGPAQAAHGANAEKMVKEYSELAAQQGITKEYDAVASLISDFRGVAKALMETLVTFKADFTAYKNAQITGGRTPANVQADLEAAFTALGVATAKADTAGVAKANKRIALHKCEEEIQRVVATTGNPGAELMARFQTLKSESEVVADEKQDFLKESAKAEARGYMKALADLEASLTAKGEGEAGEGKDKKDEGTEESNKEDREASKSDALKSLVTKIKANDQHSSDGKFGEKGGEKTEKPDEDKEKMKAELLRLTARQDEISKALGEASKGGKSAPDITPGQEASVRARVMKALDSDTLPVEAIDSARTLLQQHDAVEAGRLSKDVFARSLDLAVPSVKDLFATTH